MTLLPILNREPDDIEPTSSVPSVLLDILDSYLAQHSQLLGAVLYLTKEDIANLRTYFDACRFSLYFNPADLKGYEAQPIDAAVIDVPQRLVLARIRSASIKTLHLRVFDIVSANPQADLIVISIGFLGSRDLNTGLAGDDDVPGDEGADN